MESATFSLGPVKLPAYVPYILVLFALSRLALEAVGYAAHVLIAHHNPATLADFLLFWNVWDSNWYLGIARDGYSTAVNSVGNANYAFFPLYPALIWLVSRLTGDDLLSGVLISNACLLIACVYLCKLVALDSAEETALRSIKYLFLFPTAFIFSAVLTESLFLVLILACVYYARRGKWHAAGLLGFFTALSRPPGVVVLLPLLYEYWRQPGRKLRPEACLLLLPPLGLAVYACYNFYLTGDPLAFVHIQATWGGQPTLPLFELLRRFSRESGWVFIGAAYTCLVLGMLVFFARKVDFSSWLLGVMLTLIPLFTPQSSYSMIRYIAVVFPLFIILAKLGENKRRDLILTVVLAGVQLLFMALWTTWSPLIV